MPDQTAPEEAARQRGIVAPSPPGLRRDRFRAGDARLDFGRLGRILPGFCLDLSERERLLRVRNRRNHDRSDDETREPA